jgi:hypothetical protein
MTVRSGFCLSRIRSTLIGVLAAGLPVSALGQSSQPASEQRICPPEEFEKETPKKPAPATRNIFGLPAAPLEEPIDTDRPDFTDSPEVVPYGHIQVESGYTFTYDREGKNRTLQHAAPELLFRLGLFKDFELRIDWPGYVWQQDLFQTQTRRGRPVSKEDWSQGATDMDVGFKYHICDQKGLRPSFGVIADISAPSGSSGFSSGDVDTEVKLAWSYDFAKTWSLAGNVDFLSLTQDTHRFFQTAASLSLGKSWTKWLHTYFEYFGLYPNTWQTDCAHYLDGGFGILLNPNVQIDFRAGVGLNEEADDFFTGAGLSFRL